MFDSVKDDIARNGLVSVILKKLAEFEIFMRNHQTVNHGIKDFVDVTAWTPAVAGSAVAGAGTYTFQAGRYSRIGKVVYVSCTLAWSAHTGTGNMTVTGLPLISGNNGVTSALTVFWNNITLLAVGNKLIAAIAPSMTKIDLYEIGSGSNSNLPMDSAGTLNISGFYFVD